MYWYSFEVFYYRLFNSQTTKPNINAIDNEGVTILMIAASKGYADLVNLLI